MKHVKTHVLTRLLVLALFLAAPALNARADSGDGFSGDDKPLTEAQKKELTDRNQALVGQITSFLRKEKVFVAFISRRGAPKDAENGISDADKYDATGLAHTGLVVRTGLSDNSGYATMNLVRVKDGAGKGKDSSDLRIWTLEHFFLGTFEKDAGIFVPNQETQMKLWNDVMSYSQPNWPVEKVKVGDHEEDRQFIRNGLLVQLHNPAYSLLSDFANEKSQNCNELVAKAMFSALLNTQHPATLTRYMEENVRPYDFKLGLLGSLFAGAYNIRRDERMSAKGFEQMKVLTVEAFAAPVNRSAFRWEKLQFFREERQDGTYRIVDKGSDYVKRNSRTGKPNAKAKYFE
jgi:hypothetical protein